MHVGRRSSHPSTNHSHCEGKKTCVDIQGPRPIQCGCEGLLLSSTHRVKTAPRTAMPAVPNPALPQTTCRVQSAKTDSCLSAYSASRTPALVECSQAPICEVGRGEKRGRISPVSRKTVQHPLTSQVKGCGHAPALLCFVAERHALEGAARRTRSPAWRGRETHGCEIELRRL